MSEDSITVTDSIDTTSMPIDDHARRLIDVLVEAAHTMQGEEIRAITVGHRLVFTDAFVIVTADNTRLARAICREMVDAALEAGWKRPRVEETDDATWTLLDFGDVIAHVMTAEARDFYALERLWADGASVSLTHILSRDSVNAAPHR